VRKKKKRVGGGEGPGTSGQDFRDPV
jgi:hypothetical protein